MVPIGVGVHLAPYIAGCEMVLTKAGLKIQLHPNGTVWFVETRPHQWFATDLAFDGLVRQRFLRLSRPKPWRCKTKRCRYLSRSPIPAPLMSPADSRV